MKNYYWNRSNSYDNSMQKYLQYSGFVILLFMDYLIY